MHAASQSAPAPVPPSEQACYDELKSIEAAVLGGRPGSAATLRPRESAAQWLHLLDVVKQLQYLRSCATPPSSPLRNNQDEPPAPPEKASGVDELLETLYPLFLQAWDVGLEERADAVRLYPMYMEAVQAHAALQQMHESGAFSEALVAAQAARAEAVWAAAGHVRGLGEPGAPQPLVLLFRKVEACRKLAALLRGEVSRMHPLLRPIHATLVDIKTRSDALLQRAGGVDVAAATPAALARIHQLQSELAQVDNLRVDGKFMTLEGDVIPGQAMAIDLLETCYDDVYELMAQREPVSGGSPLRQTYEDLIAIRRDLENRHLVGRWFADPDGLVAVQRRLGAIDAARVDGKFLAPDGSIPAGQALLHGLLHRCYRLVRLVQSAADPVPAALAPLYNNLATLRRCLAELRRHGVTLSRRELLPYQLKRDSLFQRLCDSGSGRGDGEEGHAVLEELLCECDALLAELQRSGSGDDSD